jgi:hypothetical protein
MPSSVAFLCPNQHDLAKSVYHSEQLLLSPPTQEDFLMSRTSPSYAIERPLTAANLVRVRQITDQPTRRRQSSSVTIILARCIAAILMLSIVLGIGPLLRAVGGA